MDSLQAVIKELLRLSLPFSGSFEGIVDPGGEPNIPHTKSLPRNTRIWGSQYVMSLLTGPFDVDVEESLPER